MHSLGANPTVPVNVGSHILYEKKPGGFSVADGTKLRLLEQIKLDCGGPAGNSDHPACACLNKAALENFRHKNAYKWREADCNTLAASLLDLCGLTDRLEHRDEYDKCARGWAYGSAELFMPAWFVAPRPKPAIQRLFERGGLSWM